jgi:hypothetical protein
MTDKPIYLDVDQPLAPPTVRSLIPFSRLGVGHGGYDMGTLQCAASRSYRHGHPDRGNRGAYKSEHGSLW